MIDFSFFDQGGICLITRGFGTIPAVDVPIHQAFEKPTEALGGAIVRAAHKSRFEYKRLAAMAFLATAAGCIVLDAFDVQIIHKIR